MEKAQYVAKGCKMLTKPNQTMISLRGKNIPDIFQRLRDTTFTAVKCLQPTRAAFGNDATAL